MEKLAGKIMLLSGLRRVFCAIFAGAFAVLALPPFNIFAAMFVSFTLLVWLIDGFSTEPGLGFFRRFWSAFGIGWLFGLGYFVAGLWWLGNAVMVEAEDFAWALPFAILGLPAVLAIYYGFAVALARMFWSDGIGRIAALAASFGAMEWARSILFTGFPWNMIGYGMMPVPLMMQSVHVLGVLSITTLSVFVFAAPATLGTRQNVKLTMAVAIILMAGHLGYGAYVLYGPVAPAQSAATLPKPVIRLVQPMIDQSLKLSNTADRSKIFEAHLTLSSAPPENNGKKPDIIVWPETSIPFILTDNQDALTRIAEVLDDNQILITGAVRTENIGADHPERYYNSIYVIDGRGQILAASDKTHLVPFGEYVPFEDILRGLGVDNFIALPGGFSAAANRQFLRLPSGLTLLPSICYEIIFPQEMDAGAQAANVILNVTNDGWFGNSPGPYQHFQQARIRAVENRLPLIRSANTGISALVDAYGRVIKGLDLNTAGFVDATFDGNLASPQTKFPHRTYFELILGFLGLTALICRIGLFSRGIDRKRLKSHNISKFNA